MAEANRAAVKGLGLTTLSALVVANMIGAGVFTSSGYSMGALGNPGRVMLAWWLCGLWAIAGAIAYGGLARRLPLSGGEYLFLSRLVHPSIGFLAGWISVVAGFTAPIAVAAQGAAIYGLGEVESGDPRLTLVAVVVIVLAAICHLAGVAIGTGLQNAIVAAKLVLLVVIIVWAFAFSPSEVWQGKALPDQPAQWWPENLAAWTVLVGSMSWIALSYTGFNAAIYVAGQARQPRRNVPLSMLVATLAVTVIYLLLNYVFVYAPTPESIVNQNNVAAIAAQAVGGGALSLLVRVTICLAMVSSVFAMLLAGPRVYQKMAEDGVMPRIFHTPHGPPRLATVAQALLGIVAVFIADILQLMKYLGLTLSACGALAVLSLWWARRKIPSAAPLRPWETLAMAVYLLITFAILWASRTTHSDEFVAMLVTFAVGGIVYAVWSQFDRHGAQATREQLPECPPYQLLERMSGSSGGNVYLAGKPSTKDKLVVKLQAANPSTTLGKERLQQEIALLTQLDHPHIVRLVGSGPVLNAVSDTDAGLYMAVEYVPGMTLWELVHRSGAMSDRRAIPLLAQIASAVSAIHEQGYAHGDLAPKNIVVSRHDASQTAEIQQAAAPNATEQITLVDFGLSRPTDDSRTGQERPTDDSDLSAHSDDVRAREHAEPMLSGTPAFMSPESCQSSGEPQWPAVSPAADIYAFGCLAFFMLTGKLPFPGGTAIEICWKQIHQPAPRPSSLDIAPVKPELEELIMRCLEKSPAARPSTMRDIEAKLKRIGDGSQ